METKFKGTQGKWGIEKHIHGLSGNYLILNEEKYQVAIADNEFIRNSEITQANALLISKAPEMLEMLEYVKDYLGSDVREKVEKLIKSATEL